MHIWELTVDLHDVKLSIGFDISQTLLQPFFAHFASFLFFFSGTMALPRLDGASKLRAVFQTWRLEERKKNFVTMFRSAERVAILADFIKAEVSNFNCQKMLSKGHAAGRSMTP